MEQKKDTAFPFIVEDDEGKLVPLVLSYLAIGQFELARASLDLLADVSPDSAFHLLQTVIDNGPSHIWRSSAAVPSAGHLIWLCILEHDHLRERLKGKIPADKIPQPVLDSTRKLASFEMVLFDAFEVSLASAASAPKTIYSDSSSSSNPMEWLNELRWCFRKVNGISRLDDHLYATAGASVTSRGAFSAALLDNFKQLIERNPFAAHRITLDVTVGSQNASLASLAVTALHRLWIQYISQLMDNREYSRVLEAIPYLCFNENTLNAKPFAQLVQQVFLLLAEASDLLLPFIDKQQNVGIQKKDLYQAFMQCQNPEPLRCMCAAEEEHVRACYKADCDAKGVPITHSLLSFKPGTDVIVSDSKSQQEFWRYVALYSFCTKTHFMEAILLRSLSLLNENKLSDAALTIAPLGQKLKPLLILLGWDAHANDSKFHFQLLKQLWTLNFVPVDDEPDSSDPDEGSSVNSVMALSDACNQLAYRISVSRWAAEILLTSDDSSKESGVDEEALWMKVGEIMQQTVDRSLPCIIAQCLAQIPLNDLLDMIRRNPDPKASAARNKDVALIHSYDALRKVLYVIKNPQDKSQQQSQVIVDHVMAIKSAHQRLIFMRMLFSSIFLKGTSNDADCFLITADSCSFILDVLNQCCELTGSELQSEKSPGESSDRAGNLAAQQQFELNFALLKQDVNESLHRVDFARRLLARNSKTVDGISLPSEFLRLFLASPQTLLSLALQYNDYSLCNEISSFFGEVALPRDLVDISEVNETLDKIVQKITASKDGNMEDVISVCKNMIASLQSVKRSPKLMTASMADAAFRCMHSAAMPSLSGEDRKALLSRAKQLFLAAAAEAGSSTEGNALRRVLELFASLIELTTDDNDLLFSDTAVVSVEAFERDAEAQKNVILARQVKEESNLSFMKLTMHTIEGSQESEEGFCLVDSLEEVDQEREIRAYLHKRGDTFSAIDAVDFVELFLKHILTLSDALRAQISTHEKQQKLQQKLFFGLLESSPAQIVKDLIFRSDDYQSAKAIAELLHLDVDGIAIKGIATSNSELERSAAQLTLPFAQFISRSWPNIAVLMCFTRFPIDAFHGELFHFALSLPVSPEVKRWIETRTFMLDFFAKIALRKTFDDCKTAIPLSKDSAAVLGLLRSCRVEDDEEFMTKLLQMPLVGLTGRDQILATTNRAIVVADMRCDNGVSDTLLVAICNVLVNCNPPCIDVLPPVLERFTDKSKAVVFIREYFHKWNLETCMRLFSLSPDTAAEYDRMCLYQNILKLRRVLMNIEDEFVPPWLSKWNTWQDIEKACIDDAVGTIRLFLPLHEFGIARTIHKCFNAGSEAKNEIEENCLIHMLVRSQAPFSKQLQDVTASGDTIDGRIHTSESANRSVPDGMVDTSDVGLVLADMGKDAIATVVGLLKRLEKMNLKRPVWARASLFFLSFILTNMESDIPKEQKDSFKEHQLGLQAFVLLPEELQNVYFPLVHSPKQLIENMLMDRRTSELAVVFKSIPDLRDDQLIIRYARKAMEFRKQSDGKSVNRVNDVQQNDPAPFVRFTGSNISDFDTRTRFTYPRTPSVSLAKALFDLASDDIGVSNACLEACNKLADGLTATEPRADEIVDVIVSMLEYAKIIFQCGQISNTRTRNNAVEGVIQCDHFISVAKLFGKLLRNNCASTLASARTGYIDFSLHDLLSLEKARWLRDKLIENDMLGIAVDVAAQCGISAGRIWSRWGFSMLHMGDYTGAREKFEYCFTVGQNKVYQPRGAYNDDPDPTELLQQIIETLETEQDVDEAAIRCEFQSALSSVSLSSAQSSALPPTPFSSGDASEVFSQASDGSSNAPMKTVTPDGSVVYDVFKPIHLVEAITAECMYYLKAYGTTKDLLAFLLRHGCLKEACQICLDENVSSQQFMEDVLLYCLQHAQLKDLQKTMLELDSSLEKWKDYLMKICGFFDKHKAFDVLIDFQSFMHDYARAGKTALVMSTELGPMEFTRKLELLALAKKMFAEALEHQSAVPQSGLSLSDISLFLRGADLQMAVTQLFQKNVKQIPIELLSLSVFGTNADKTRLAEECLLLGNYDTSFGIIQDFRLSAVKVYSSAGTTITRSVGKARGGMSRINDFLKQAKANLMSSELESVTIASMEVFVNELHDVKSAEKLLSKLTTNKERIRGQALCGQFKAAYMAASQLGLVEEVKYILALAETRDATYADRCRQFLREHEMKTRVQSRQSVPRIVSSVEHSTPPIQQTKPLRQTTSFEKPSQYGVPIVSTTSAVTRQAQTPTSPQQPRRVVSGDFGSPVSKTQSVPPRQAVSFSSPSFSKPEQPQPQPQTQPVQQPVRSTFSGSMHPESSGTQPRQQQQPPYGGFKAEPKPAPKSPQSSAFRPQKLAPTNPFADDDSFGSPSQQPASNSGLFNRPNGGSFASSASTSSANAQSRVPSNPFLDDTASSPSHRLSTNPFDDDFGTPTSRPAPLSPSKPRSTNPFDD